MLRSVKIYLTKDKLPNLEGFLLSMPEGNNFFVKYIKEFGDKYYVKIVSKGTVEGSFNILAEELSGFGAELKTIKIQVDKEGLDEVIERYKDYTIKYNILLKPSGEYGIKIKSDELINEFKILKEMEKFR